MGIPVKGLVHKPCPWCGSSDAAVTYQSETDKDFFYTKCYSCGVSKPVAGTGEPIEMSNESSLLLLTDGGETPEPHRGLTRESLRHYHVIENEGSVYFPYFTPEGFLAGQKIRKLTAKSFSWVKSENREDFERIQLFGANLRRSSDKTVLIAEGEYDAISAHQLLGGQSLCVSIVNGAQSGCTQRQIEWLNSFDKIYICFDNDEPGKKASEKLAGILGPKKSAIVTIKGYKDANELLEKEGSKAYKIFADAYFHSKPHKPESIILGRETYDAFLEEREEDAIPFPWESMEKVVPGMCLGRLYVISAGSGVGKSILNKSLGYHIWLTTKDKNVGCLFLEESLKDTVSGFVGLHIGKNLFVHRDTPKATKLDAWNEMFKEDPQRFMFWNNFGSNSIEAVEATIRYMAIQFEARYIFLDHVSMMVSSQEHGDERKTLDAIMTKLRTLCQELNICLFVVSHLRRSDGVPHEEGGVTSLAQLRGSAAIGQLADVVLGLERNGQHECPWERNLTTIRVLKNRITGETGPACHLWWNRDTSLLEEVPDDEESREKLRNDYLGKIRRKTLETLAFKGCTQGNSQ